MKTTHSFLYTLLISILVVWLSGGCNADKNEANPKSTCRIEKYVAISKSKLYEGDSQITYEYDTQGNLVKTLVTSDKRPTSGTVGSQTGTKTLTYTYNPDGYVTASITQELYQTTTNKTTQEQITTTERFEYTNGRLSTHTKKRIGAYGITTNTIELFAYNSTGELTTKTVTSTSVVHDPAIAKELPIGSGESRQILTYQNNQLVDYVQKSGSSEIRPLTIQNGLVTTYTLPSTDGNLVVAYTYDEQQRTIKTDESLGGIPTHSYVQTWNDAKSAETTLPIFKGWPTNTQEYGKTGVLLMATQSYRNTVSGKTEVFLEQTSAVQTNAQGFVTGNVIILKHPNPATAEQDYTTTETYTYSGCQ